jgi:hypothetical protein
MDKLTRLSKEIDTRIKKLSMRGSVVSEGVQNEVQWRVVMIREYKDPATGKENNDYEAEACINIRGKGKWSWTGAGPSKTYRQKQEAEAAAKTYCNSLDKYVHGRG